MAQFPPVKTVVARYYGPYQTVPTAWYYWVQPVFEAGDGPMSTAGAVLNGPSGMSSSQYVAVSWDAAPGAIGYRVWRTTTTSPPGSGVGARLANLTSQTGVKDNGVDWIPVSNATPRVDGILVAKGIYNFATDGGAISTITPAISDLIPSTAILVGATINSTTAPVGAGASVSIGTSAGSTTTSILAATVITSLTADALLAGVPTFAAPRKMTAAGQITFTITAAALTAGVIECSVYYIVASNQ